MCTEIPLYYTIKYAVLQAFLIYNVRAISTNGWGDVEKVWWKCRVGGIALACHVREDMESAPTRSAESHRSVLREGFAPSRNTGDRKGRPYKHLCTLTLITPSSVICCANATFPPKGRLFPLRRGRALTGPQPDGHKPVQAQGRNRHRVKQVPDEAAERLNGRDSRRYLSAGIEWRGPKGLRKGDI